MPSHQDRVRANNKPVKTDKQKLRDILEDIEAYPLTYYQINGEDYIKREVPVYIREQIRLAIKLL